MEREKKKNLNPEEKKKERLEQAMALKRTWKRRWRTWRTASESENEEENTNYDKSTMKEQLPEKSPTTTFLGVFENFKNFNFFKTNTQKGFAYNSATKYRLEAV